MEVKEYHQFGGLSKFRVPFPFSVVSDEYIGDRQVLTVKFRYENQDKYERIYQIQAENSNNVSKTPRNIVANIRAYLKYHYEYRHEYAILLRIGTILLKKALLLQEEPEKSNIISYKTLYIRGGRVYSVLHGSGAMVPPTQKTERVLP